MSQSTFSFSLHSPTRFGPRLGAVILKRSGGTPSTESSIEIATPGLLAMTSRGVIPHLSRDHVRMTDAIRWVNVPFETFMEHTPPIPTLHAQQSGSASTSNPLHTFLGFIPNKHILSMSARDPHDGRDMPPNGNAHVLVHSLRGVRKLAPTDWRSYVQSCQPDIVFALSDTPFKDPPYSQKRLTKSIERSAAWLVTLLNPKSPPIPPQTSRKKTSKNIPPPAVDTPTITSDASPTTDTRIPPIFVHLAGLTSPGARKAFADSLVEPLFGPEAEAIKPLTRLDEGIAGYSVDLVPLRSSIEAAEQKLAADRSSPIDFPKDDVDRTYTSQIVPLLQISLSPLPSYKPRLLTATQSPHEILEYIGAVGVDLFDAGWAQRAADFGVALDFNFPMRAGVGSAGKEDGPREIGHNLYHVGYRLDFGPLADSFRGALPAPHTTASPSFSAEDDKPICPCAACSPISPSTQIYHGHDHPSASGEAAHPTARALPHYSRAYIHHLLHTHEMSAHALLVMHNLAVVDAFFAGVRGVIAEGVEERWKEEVRRFGEAYDGQLGVLEEARERWREVDLARGKGRLARERDKQVVEVVEVVEMLEVVQLDVEP